MITLTQKEYDLLKQVADFEPVDGKPFKVVSNNNGSVANLVAQGLVQARPKEGNALMQELAITILGTQVINNAVEHEIQISGSTEQQKETKMDEQNEVQQESNHSGYVIESGIPIPDNIYTRKARESKLPLDKMLVDQSFVIPFKEGEDPTKGIKRVRSNVSMNRRRLFGKGSTQQFVVGIVENGYRVWRKA